MKKKQRLLSLFLALALTVPAPLVLAAEPEDGTEPRPEAAVSAEAEVLPETPAGPANPETPEEAPEAPAETPEASEAPPAPGEPMAADAGKTVRVLAAPRAAGTGRKAVLASYDRYGKLLAAEVWALSDGAMDLGAVHDAAVPEGTLSLRLMALDGDGAPIGPSKSWW